MAWRVLEVGDVAWNVSIAAERRANSDRWGLVLSFRSAGSHSRAFWAEYPLGSTSRSALYAQAEQLKDSELKAILSEHLRTR